MDKQINKIKISKKELIKNLLNRDNMELTLQRVVIYLNLTGTYLTTNKTWGLFEVDLTQKKCKFHHTKRYLNKIFAPAIFNSDDIETINSYLEYIYEERAKDIELMYLENKKTYTNANILYAVRRQNEELRKYYELVEV